MTPPKDDSVKLEGLIERLGGQAALLREVAGSSYAATFCVRTERLLDLAAQALQSSLLRERELEAALDPSNEWILATAQKFAWPQKEDSIKALAMDLKSAFHEARSSLKGEG